MLESPDNASDFNSANSPAMKKFADFPSLRANASMLCRMAHSRGHISVCCHYFTFWCLQCSPNIAPKCARRAHTAWSSWFNIVKCSRWGENWSSQRWTVTMVRDSLDLHCPCLLSWPICPSASWAIHIIFALVTCTFLCHFSLLLPCGLFIGVLRHVFRRMHQIHLACSLGRIYQVL